MVKTGIILAGGKSLRMGYDKQEIKLNGMSLMQNNIEQMLGVFDTIIISTNRPIELYKKYDRLSVVSDGSIGIGPLMGLKSGLEMCQTPYAYVLGCDVIFDVEIARFFVSHLEGAIGQGLQPQMVLAEKEADFYEPFNGIYAKSLVSKLEDQLLMGHYKVQDFIRGNHNKVRISHECIIEKGMTKIYMNFNSKSQILAYEKAHEKM